MGEYVAEKFTVRGYTVKIIADQDAEPPDAWDDDGLFIVTTRNRYFQKLRNGEDAHACMDKDLTKRYWVFPLFMYAHSGIALSLGAFSDPWDSGQVGFVFVAKSEWKYRTRERKLCVSAHSAAKSYVETWNQYLSGDVWGYVIEDADGEHVDSCCGFYGLENAKQEATSAVPKEPSCPSDSEAVEETLA